MGVSTSKPREIKSVYFPEFEEELPSLEGKVVAITGCTSGTGIVAARTCARKQAKVVLMLNRPSERAENAEKEVKLEVKDGSTTVETIPCDLQSFDSVKEAATKIKAKYDVIDVLCCNAGVMALDDYATKDGYDVQMQTNHLSHFLLTAQLLPLLKKAKGQARIVHHTSMARLGPLLDAKYFGKNGGDLGGNRSFMFTGPKWDRYHQSKLANVVFTQALKDKLEGTNVIATVAAPGLAATNLQVTTSQTGGMGWASMGMMRMAQSAEDGTMPLLSACFLPCESGVLWEPSNRGGLHGPAKVKELEKECVDEESRKMLWETSEAACGKFEL